MRFTDKFTTAFAGSGRYALMALALTLGGCQTTPNSTGCRIEGPLELMPERIKQVRLGMSQNELENLLGPADYSPTEGVFYYSTGGDCPLEDCPLDDANRVASCGLVVEFRDYSSYEVVISRTLQSCWWGAIGE